MSDGRSLGECRPANDPTGIGPAYGSLVFTLRRQTRGDLGPAVVIETPPDAPPRLATRGYELTDRRDAMRVTLLCEYPTLNGGEHSLLAVVDELAGRVAFDALAPPAGSLADAFRERGVAVAPLTLAGPDGRRGTKDESVARLADALAARDADVIHANSLAMSRLLGAARERLAGHPAACTGHVRDIRKLKKSEVADLAELDRLVAVSHATQQNLRDCGAPREVTTVVNNGIDARRFHPDLEAGRKLRRELALPPDAPVVLTVGQICLRKGHDVAAEAVLAAIADEPRPIHWLVAGLRHSVKAESVAFDEALDRRFADVGKSDRFHRLGLRDDVPTLMAGADLLLHAARQEPFGRVLLEAAATGLPIVATDVGGTREIFGKPKIVIPKIGFHTPESILMPEPDDPPALADAILHTLADPAAAAERAAAARDHVRRCYPVRKSADGLLRVWTDALARN